MAGVGTRWKIFRPLLSISWSFLLAAIFVSAERSLKREQTYNNATHQQQSDANYLTDVVNFLWKPNESGYQHVWPDMKFGWKIIVGSIIGFLGAAFGSVGGVGGGGIFVPMLSLIVGFDPKSSTAISKCMIMGASVSTVYYNLKLRHPTIDMPIIDYDLAVLIQPMLMLGISIGVTFNVIFADWMVTVLLIILFIATSTKAFLRGVETWKKETIMQKEAEAAKKSGINGAGEEAEYKLLPGGSNDDPEKKGTDSSEPEVPILENVCWKEVGLLSFVWVAFLGLQIGKNYTDNCTALYWVVNLLQIPVSLGVSSYEAISLYKGWRRIESKGDQGTNFRVLQLIVYCFFGVVAGMVGGLLGLGGGFIMGPMFLELGVPPQVSSATATFAMMFSSSMSVVEYYLLKRFPVPYAAYFVAVATVAALVGQHVVTEWIELMERLVQQNYFDHKRKDEDKLIEDLGFNVAEVAEDEGFDFTRDWKTVQTAVLNFGKDRFDILRSLSRQDLQILVGYGCPSADKKVVFSAKLLRKHVHLDEGDVCSSCNLRSSCERAYLLTNKEDEARTIDVMRVLLTYGFDAINGSVVNESLTKKKSVKTVVRKLLHEVVKLSAVPIDPNLPPPIFKKPPPKVKQPPPPPKKRVGRDDIEMKKGDWLCPKCDFMNFAKNTICLQCDANRPKRQLLPGEWECPQCNFLNYRRNVVCFHCECKRPADDYMVTQQQERQHGPRMQMDKVSRRQDVSNAWNFDFDDDESDGADVATFEHADSQKLDEDFPLDRREQRDTSRDNEDGFYKSSRPPKGYETEYPAPGKPGVGFNDFDDEDDDDVDSYEIESNGTNRSSRIDFSDIEVNSESEDIDNADSILPVGGRNSSLTSDAHFRSRHQQGAFRGSEDAEVDFDTDDDLPIKTNGKSNQASYFKPRSRNKGAMSFVSENDGLSSDSDDEDFTSRQNKGNKWGSRRDFGRRSSSYSEDEPSSDLESNNGRSFNKNRQRGGKAGQNGRWDSSEGRGDRMRDKRTSFKDNSKRTSRDSRGSSRRSQDNGYNDYKSRGREESYKQQRGRNNNYGDRSDSYLDDERHRRPRINVR